MFFIFNEDSVNLRNLIGVVYFIVIIIVCGCVYYLYGLVSRLVLLLFLLLGYLF